MFTWQAQSSFYVEAAGSGCVRGLTARQGCQRLTKATEGMGMETASTIRCGLSSRVEGLLRYSCSQWHAIFIYILSTYALQPKNRNVFRDPWRRCCFTPTNHKTDERLSPRQFNWYKCCILFSNSRASYAPDKRIGLDAFPHWHHGIRRYAHTTVNFAGVHVSLVKMVMNPELMPNMVFERN